MKEKKKKEEELQVKDNTPKDPFLSKDNDDKELTLGEFWRMYEAWALYWLP